MDSTLPRAEKDAVCRICAGQCSLLFELDDDGVIVGTRGEKANPLTRGYACIKGLTLADAHYSPADRRNISPAFDLSRPPIDFVSIAKGLGVDGLHVVDGEGLQDAITRAGAARRPCLLQIRVT